MPSGTPTAPFLPTDVEHTVLADCVLRERGATLADLRTVNNRDGRPYEEKTIINYVGRARTSTRG